MVYLVFRKMLILLWLKCAAIRQVVDGYIIFEEIAVFLSFQ